MVKFFTKEFWTDEEIKNTFVHASFGFVGAWIAFLIFQSVLISIAVGTGIGLIVEIKQYFTNDHFDLKLADRLRDLLFWFLGSVGPTLVYFSLKFFVFK